MTKKDGGGIIHTGIIDTQKIYETHTQVKEIVESYKDVNKKVSEITLKVQKNWVGKGSTEFESQYNLLISKIEDFGDALQEIYEALVKAEAEYETTDDSIRQKFVMSMSEAGESNG